MRSRFRVGEFLIMPLEGRIFGPTGNHHVQPKTMDVLLCLVEAVDEVVERNALLERVWGSTLHSDEVLSDCISDLRHYLGDHADSPQYIQTVPKRGYRLIADVVPDNPPEVSDTEEASDSKSLSSVIWKELKQRNVVRVALAFGTFAWLTIQVVDTVAPIFGWPRWVIKVIFVTLAVGFVVSVVLAWVYEIVPDKRVFGKGVTKTQRRKLHRYVDYGIVISLLLVTVLVLLGPLEPERRSVAILRFLNIGGDQSFSDGIGEGLLTLLSSFKELSVPSRHSSWALSNQEFGSIEIAERLHVRYLLEGSVQQRGENVRVTAQLVDGQSGNHVWSKEYDAELTAENYFEIRDDITNSLLDELKISLSIQSEQQLTRTTSTSIAAINAYNDGLAALREANTETSLTAAVDAFLAAIGLDSNYGKAHAGLCEAQLGWFVMTRDPHYFDKAQDACLSAAKKDDSRGEVYIALGTLYRYKGQYEEAETELARAGPLLPNTSLVLEESGRVYRSQNKLVKAEKSFRDAQEMDPANWSVHKSLGNFLFRTGRFSDAVIQYRQVITLDPQNWPGYNNLGAAYFMLGDMEKALDAWNVIIDDNPTRMTLTNYANALFYRGEYDQSAAMYRRSMARGANDHRIWRAMGASLRQVPGREAEAREAYLKAIDLAKDTLDINAKNQETLSQIAVSYVWTEQPELAHETLDALNVIGWEDPNVSYFVALALLQLGNREGAIDELQRAVVLGFPKAWLNADPDFTVLKDDQKFAALVGQQRDEG